MNRKNILLGIVFLIGALFCIAVWLFYFNDVAVIKRKVTALADTASFVPDEGNIQVALKINQMGKFFTDDAKITVSVNHLSNTFSSASLVANMGPYFKFFRTCTLTAKDIEVKMQGSELAEVEFDGSFIGWSREKNSEFRENGEIKCIFVKEKREWKIRNLEVISRK